ncbi:MAG: hypothetical protein EHM72_05820 [Calditrichaeota bacterium]|nr:MAG: hypothetical protein EHM72_05820 [Calditrichota bacterium]
MVSKKRILNPMVILALILISAHFIASCSQDNIPLPSKSHSDQWINPESGDFHGVKVVTIGANSCKSCHGSDYSGGKSGKSCHRCHANFPHPSQWLTPESDQFHGNDIRNNNWSMTECKKCHGDDYRGGSSASSCFPCHAEPAGPEACTVCHGNSEHANPPEDLQHNTATFAIGVGAHEKHVKIFACSICHTVPSSFGDATHVDLPPAEVNSAWSWDRTTGTCATSCHGSVLKWTEVSDH